MRNVALLFKGRSELLVGFNKFLPDDLKIEVNASDLGTVSVTGPSGLLEHYQHPVRVNIILLYCVC